MKLPDFFEADHAAIEAALDRLLPPEATLPTSIHRAMRYSVFAGGKRIRPVLCLEAARMFTENLEAAIQVGCALEFIHTYSLIHDDLPALDNDDLRRGKPTNHKVFGEAIAILAGDGLLTLAFQTLAGAPLEPARRVRVIAEISAAAGTVNGMVGGQVADIEAEGKPPDVVTLEYIHRSKTAALIRSSIVAGSIAGGAADEDADRLRRFGNSLGWAFQVVDDILDVEESSAALGKTAGKDAAQEKATYPSLYGLEKSRAIAAELEAEALKAIAPYGGRAGRLRQLAEFLAARRA
ncbi:MAG TPA: farnesyl diphosphate synthase [Candidatus Polarisedimenticolia bacterium]|nr:farnesyl diphosphate synthase [Candidatus Polarisedimenticolia bacterium]